SAIVADLIDIARERSAPVWGAAAHSLDTSPPMAMARHVGPFYLRLMVLDQPGVIADVTGVLRDEGISLASMLQRGRAPGEAVPVVLVTHDCEEARMQAALARIEALAAVVEAPMLIRIETL
ncbi:MAG TPA: ACT domain-containing protein, partial [Roseococcus sp.]|nr:ACT domain-containing protein [Roseococcus sp.]